MKTLLILDEDYADEFQCQQYRIVDNEREAVEVIGQLKDEDELYFGTNEYLDGPKLTIDTKEITDEQAQFLEDTLGSSFGTGVLTSI